MELIKLLSQHFRINKKNRITNQIIFTNQIAIIAFKKQPVAPTVASIIKKNRRTNRIFVTAFQRETNASVASITNLISVTEFLTKQNQPVVSINKKNCTTK